MITLTKYCKNLKMFKLETMVTPSCTAKLDPSSYHRTAMQQQRITQWSQWSQWFGFKNFMQRTTKLLRWFKNPMQPNTIWPAKVLEPLCTSYYHHFEKGSLIKLHLKQLRPKYKLYMNTQLKVSSFIRLREDVFSNEKFCKNENTAANSKRLH